MVVAARVVDPRASSAAIGLVATGSSIAQIVGMPLGRAIGLALGWRMTFAAMGVASVATLAYLAVHAGLPCGCLSVHGAGGAF